MYGKHQLRIGAIAMAKRYVYKVYGRDGRILATYAYKSNARLCAAAFNGVVVRKVKAQLDTDPNRAIRRRAVRK